MGTNKILTLIDDHDASKSLLSNEPTLCSVFTHILARMQEAGYSILLFTVIIIYYSSE